MTDPREVTFWLPTWWDWHQNWDECQTCIQYNGAPCASCEIPPGLLALGCLVGGGTAVVGGSIRGNATIASQRQANAAARQHSVEQVNVQLDAQQVNEVVRNEQLRNLQGRDAIR